MPHFAVLLRGGPLADSFSLRADGYEERGDSVVFLRDDRVVHQVPSAWVAAIEVHPDALAARDAVAAHRAAKTGGATIHVQENAAAAPRRRGGSGAPTAVPAEGVSIRIDEGPRR
ncbi:MAG: hypothetical protein EP329_06190 [Deltaproteobacteria bacterium]|nr:MAG: hypothetical protein EP329_06190 [Deltaproteobacteria bacterium]